MTGHAARVLLLTAAAAAWTIPHVSAWERDVHHAIAILAEERLSDSVRKEVSALLKGESMAQVSVWAEDVRNTTHRETYNWHFVNIPIAASGYDAARDCRDAPRGDCIIAALTRMEQTLADRSVSVDRRREALAFLVHLVADLHQPLHVSNDGDLGGNRRAVPEIGGTTNLHNAWDRGILDASRKSLEDVLADARRISRDDDRAAVVRGSYVDWADEGFRIAVRTAYPQLADDGRISDDEREAALALILTQIARAGVRLAAVIERALPPVAVLTPR